MALTWMNTAWRNYWNKYKMSGVNLFQIASSVVYDFLAMMYGTPAGN
jgi:hypothetical protein